MSEGDRPESASSPPPGGGLPPRETPEFKVVRRAPVEEETSFLPMILLAVVLLLVGAFFLFRGGDEAAEPEDGGGKPAVVVPKDVEVPAFVYERLTFLENEGRFDKALSFAEEQVETFPNAELRKRIARYERELGITSAPARPVPELLSEAKKALDGRAYAEAIGLADQVLAQQPENAQAYFLRGAAQGMRGDTLAAVNDLQSSIDLGYTPASEPEALIDRFQQQ